MDPDTHTIKPSWRPIPALQRRILGVLVEKAKTTPAGYPLSLNAVVTGCNQKSNRHPQMNVKADNVEEALDQLRHIGAVGEVIGGGRVSKYRHYMKDWLGVDGTELAVMAELLLRGAQTIGELRGRAARMAKIEGIAELRPILAALSEKGLLIALSPPGRGQVVTHALYRDKEMEELQQQHGAVRKVEAAADGECSEHPASPPAPASTPPDAAPAAAVSPAPAASGGSGEVAALRAEVAELRGTVEQLKRDIQDLWDSLK
jgi:uncharacterized protein YceH (UPF0502 family)